MEKPQRKIKNFLILAVLFLLPVYLIKIKFGWISFNALELLIMILFFLWFFYKNTKYPPTGDHPQGDKMPDTKYNIPVILIFAGLLLSVIINSNYYVGLGAIKGWFIFPIIFGIIFYDSLKNDSSLLKKSLLALFFSGAAVSAMGIVYKFCGFFTYDGRLSIFYDSPNQLAMFLAIPFLIGIISTVYGTWRMIQMKYYWLLWLGTIAMAFNLYLTKSYGAWFALTVVLIVIFWLKYDKISQKKYLAILAAIVLIFIGWASFGKYVSFENSGGRSSLDSRIMIWRSAGRMIGNNLFFGIGPGNFQDKYLEYQKYFPPYLEWAVPQPHNLFLAFWLEAGFIGLAGFVWLLVQFFLDNKKAMVDNRLYGTICLAAMLYFLIHGLVDTTYWRNDMAVVFWGIIGINIFLSTNKTTYNDKISNF